MSSFSDEAVRRNCPPLPHNSSLSSGDAQWHRWEELVLSPLSGRRPQAPVRGSDLREFARVFGGFPSLRTDSTTLPAGSSLRREGSGGIADPVRWIPLLFDDALALTSASSLL